MVRLRGWYYPPLKITTSTGHLLTKLRLRYYPDAPAAYSAYQAGEIAGIGDVTSDILPEVLKEEGSQHLHNSPAGDDDDPDEPG